MKRIALSKPELVVLASDDVKGYIKQLLYPTTLDSDTMSCPLVKTMQASLANAIIKDPSLMSPDHLLNLADYLNEVMNQAMVLEDHLAQAGTYED